MSLRPIMLAGLFGLTACIPPTVEEAPEDAPQPGLPAVTAQPAPPDAALPTPQPEPAASLAASAQPARAEGPAIWRAADGVEDLVWEDLLPEGAAEDLARQYAEFYAELERRYQANAMTLAEAGRAGALDAIPEGSELDYMPQLGSFDVVEELDGLSIRIPGYVVPFDFDLERRQQTFLFVPYMGACIHTPPPPPNQLIHVRADPPIRVDDIWVPYIAQGVLRTSVIESDLGDAAYTLELDKLNPFEE